MKKCFIVIICGCNIACFAQNVGIGTTTPAERLHVIQTADADKNVIYGYANQISSGLDYQNTGVTGFGQGNGVAGGWGYGFGMKGIGSTNSWGAVGVYAALGTTIPPLILGNYFYALYANVQTTASNRYAAVFLNGNVGIGTTTPAEKMDVAGNINLTGLLKLNGLNGNAGEVLVSNGSLSPTWQGLANPQTGFSVQQFFPTTISIPNFSDTHVTFHTGGPSDFNDGNGFDNASGNYICPSTGMYSFEAQISWPNITSPAGLSILKNGFPVLTTQDKLTATGAPFNQTCRISALIKCIAGDMISINAIQASGSSQFISNSISTYFSGYKVY